jgi:hypothetical protein
MKDCIERNTVHQENNPDHQQLRRMRQKEEFLALGEGVQNGDPRYSPHSPVANRDNFVKIQNGPNGKLRGRGKLICEKTQS